MNKFKTRNGIIQKETLDYLKTLDKSKPIDPQKLEEDLINRINAEISIQNVEIASKGEPRLQFINTLTNAQIADILIDTQYVARIPSNDESTNIDEDQLIIYNKDGENKGIYSNSNDLLYQAVVPYNYNVTLKDFEEIKQQLRNKAPRITINSNRDLIAVENGIFDYKTKELMPFSPNYVFMSKSHVAYKENVKNPIIVHPETKEEWDVESWMKSLSDDEEIVSLLWELLSAIIRPHVSWNKSAWLYSSKGNNGKGTFCVLMRNLCGRGSYASIPISDFGKEFMLEPLTRASAIIVDENDVGTFIDRAANLKAIVTQDIILINRKHKTPIPFKFQGFMVQCLNEFPRVKDRSDSFYRRQLFIPMEKSFTGIEKRYIKDEYLYRDDVLEYVLHKVLHTNFYTLSEPEKCKMTLEQYKEYNDPVRDFFGEFSEEFVWDILPFSFLYDLFKQWYYNTNPSGKVIGRNMFIDNLCQIVENNDQWKCEDRRKKLRSENAMKEPETLIYDYELANWYNPNYKGDNPTKLSQPKLRESYRGLERNKTVEG